MPAVNNLDNNQARKMASASPPNSRSDEPGYVQLSPLTAPNSNNESNANTDEEPANRKAKRANTRDSLRQFPEVPWWRDCTSDYFGMCVGAVIVFNAIVIGLETDMGTDHFIFTVLEWFFFVFFVLEMLWKICQLQGEWAKSAWNIFDAVLVAGMISDMFIFPMLNGGRRSNMSSVLRLLRMARIMRVIRLFKMFSGLIVILQAFAKAIGVVGWVGLLTVLIDYVCAIVLTQAIGHHAYKWGDQEEDVKAWFGTIPRSMASLFVIMTLAEWDSMAHTLDKVIPQCLVWPFFIGYILVISYSMTSLITGAVSESLITARMEDDRLRQNEYEEARETHLHGLRQVFRTLDTDGSGYIDHDEIKKAIAAYPEVLAKLEALDVAVEEDELLEVFDKLSRGKAMGIDEFVEGLRSLAGSASAAALFEFKTDWSDDAERNKAAIIEVKREVSSLQSDMGKVHLRLDKVDTKLDGIIEMLRTNKSKG
eukprot:gnl/TRDRNA2_/TRDRNA2_39755_c0_seq1.p1 gnl/TRDRNA2_/TRDRNA2_39755_c0~~gnl/TRDRNA2_/TRDRNA2_39755_c0_seq1.p1  ORF type:complete len:480 (+),score=85.64 gnl/TRDRNA2_/TRDRNA2_39755_c0_seq1:125-1564(+)